MPRTADVIIRDGPATLLGASGGGRNFVIESQDGSLYSILFDDWYDVSFKKSSDGGLTWGVHTTVFSGLLTALAVWFDRWTPGLTTDLIHIVYTESTNDDTLYRTINTASADALSTETVVFAGATTVNPGGALAVVRASGGNVYCRTTIDAGVEGGFYRLPNANVPNGAWDAVRTVDETLASGDQWILVPGFAADTQDIMMIFSDASASELSRKIYDDSANTWAETSIATSMATGSFTDAGPHFAACCMVADSQIYVAGWSASDTLNADLRFWTLDETTITEGTNVVLNSTDDQGLCAIGYDSVSEAIYVFYCGKSDGSETAWTALNIYYKVSTDGGTTWGAETQLTNRSYGIVSIWCCPRTLGGPPLVCFLDSSNSAQPQYRCVAPISSPRAQSMIGM